LLTVRNHNTGLENDQDRLSSNITGVVPKLTLGPFLTLKVRNGHKFEDWVFGILAHIQSKRK